MQIEIPIFDGSAYFFKDAIQDVGIKTLGASKNFSTVEKHTYIKKGNNYISIYPHDGLVIDATIKFNHPVIGTQHFLYDVFNDNFNTIANARTFGIIEHIKEAKKRGLLKGGTFDCAVVLDNTSILNGPLRYKDEFIRHKVLDILGDIYIDGPIKGYIETCCSSHTLVHDLMLMLKKFTMKINNKN
jgi:UDP-3-O-[3-hydroxymyristoyl] N-acetylglucosamine deacetylase